MTVKLIPIPDADLEALRQIRSVIADAVGHPAREAAIAAIDRIAANHGRHWCQRPECCKGKFAEAHPATARALAGGPRTRWRCPGCGALKETTVPVARLGCDVCGKWMQSIVLVVDDPVSVKHVAPSPDAVMAWCAAAGVSVPERPAVSRDGDILRIAPEAAPPWPQHEIQVAAGGAMVPGLQIGHMANAASHGLAVVQSVSREPACDAPGCVGHVRSHDFAAKCIGNTHIFSTLSSSAIVNFESGHRCLCGAVTYAEAGQHVSR